MAARWRHPRLVPRDVGFVAGMLLSAQGVILYANLGRDSWENARTLGPAIVVSMVGVGGYGGWGYRGLPCGATLMVRSGPCLVIEYVAGGQFAVSVDDAERGAGLLNALRAAPTPRS